MGSHIIAERFAAAANNPSSELVESVRDDVVEMLRQHFKPEFLNRVDEIIMFEPLDRTAVEKIVDMQLRAVAKMLGNNGVEFIYTAAARRHIADIGFDARYGARPIKRTIQREVLNELSKRILAGKVDRERPIKLDADGEGLTFEN